MTNLTVQQYLRGLGDGSIQPEDVEHGICIDLWWMYDSEIEEVFQDLYPKWEDFSGNDQYPISTHKGVDEEDQYMDVGNKWDNTPYGDARRRLCTWASENWPSDEEIS